MAPRRELVGWEEQVETGSELGGAEPPRHVRALITVDRLEVVDAIDRDEDAARIRRPATNRIMLPAGTIRYLGGRAWGKDDRPCVPRRDVRCLTPFSTPTSGCSRAIAAVVTRVGRGMDFETFKQLFLSVCHSSVG